MPSPQADTHSPALQSGSISQNGVQPSPRSLFPSSHGSSPSRTPSPQTVSRQSLGSSEQTQPSSSWQVAEQPSSSRVLPSSHCSRPRMRPSPQIGRHTAPGGHSQPSSSAHVAEQPSPSFLLPSSQVSAPITLRSPQTTSETQGSPGTGQDQLSSITQSALQPSPLAGGSSPSSHCSPRAMSRLPSPHQAMRVQTLPTFVQS